MSGTTVKTIDHEDPIRTTTTVIVEKERDLKNAETSHLQGVTTAGCQAVTTVYAVGLGRRGIASTRQGDNYGTHDKGP